MSKARKCDWCGKKIAAKEHRVKLPVFYDGPAMTYHVECYCSIFRARCLRAIAAAVDAEEEDRWVAT